ncbi:MAG: tRNA (N6-isopentenyl adenosine(37)-C2)-methylthiotransferase MiaB [Planctomycetota bacterium]
MSEEPKKVCIVTFGCQMNKLDSQLLRGELRSAGFRFADEPEEADVVLYNTCSVRDHAENRVLSHLGTYRRRARRQDGFVLGVIGCMAQRMGRELLSKFDHLSLLCGTRALERVPGHLRHIMAGGGPVVDLDGEGVPRLERRREMRTSPCQAYVSAMRGCNNFCSYCIVPHVRGREVSRAPGEVVDEVRSLADDGVCEVTLLGQNVNSYRHGETRLPGLLERLNGVAGLERIRFVTSHPGDVTDDLLHAVAELSKVCEHLHVPPQSGSDRVLERMRRGYTRREYLDMVRRAREVVPELALAGDFIVGFPGETDEDFERTLDLLRRMRFQQAFLFKYSPRPGTRAAEWPDDVPDEVKRERHQRLLAAQQEVDATRRRAMVGREVEVLVEGPSPQDPENFAGRTRQNDIVVFPARQGTEGVVQRLRIVDATTLTLFGEPPDRP